jgi:hypothetical protein
MGISQELLGQGRVVGGHLSGGTILSGASTPFSKNSDLSIQHTSSLFKRPKINAETVAEWEELDGKEGVAGAMGRAAATAAIPGRLGKGLGAGLGAGMNAGHSVRVLWADGKESIIELPGKQFKVFSVLLRDRQIVTELSKKPQADAPPAPPGVTEKFADLALSIMSRGKQESPTAEAVPVQDVAEQIAKLGALHAQGILTDAEFSDKKAELLKRL